MDQLRVKNWPCCLCLRVDELRLGSLTAAGQELAGVVAPQLLDFVVRLLGSCACVNYLSFPKLRRLVSLKARVKQHLYLLLELELQEQVLLLALLRDLLALNKLLEELLLLRKLQNGEVTLPLPLRFHPGLLCLAQLLKL